MAIPLRARLFLSPLSLVALASLLLGAREGSACAVCFVAEEETRVAFFVTTALLTLMPLVFAGGVVYWLVKRARELQREEEAAAAPHGEVTGVGASVPTCRSV